MMLETVTLLNAAQTYWRLTVLHNAHERQICRGVFDIGVFSLSLSLLNTHTSTQTDRVCPSLMQSDSVLCVHTRKNTHSQATAATVIFPTVARLVLQVTLCCWSWAEAQIRNDSPWPPAHPEKWMQGFIITGSTQHIIDPNKDPHVQFKLHMALKPRRALTQLSN